MPIHTVHRILLVALLLTGCGDDTTSSLRSEVAADSGTRRASMDDAGHHPATDSAASADEQAVALRFHAQLGEQPLACGSQFAGQGSTGQTITLRDLRLFIQDVALVDADGQEVPVRLDTRDPWQNAEVALLDFEDSTGDCFGNEETNDAITGVVPRGDYVALRFSHGVPEHLNHSDPKQFPPPLKTPGMSWSWLLGLRFVKLELGAVEAEEVDAGAGPGSFSLHVGSTGCAGNLNAGTIQCAKPNRSRIELKDFELGKSEIVLDVSPLLSEVDLSQTVECHSGTAVCEPLFEALGVSYTSGAPAGDQRVFRLK